MHFAVPVWPQVNFETTENSVISHYQDKVLDNRISNGLFSPGEILKVFVGTNIDSITATGTSILGNYSVVQGQIMFEPAIPFNSNLRYFATFGDSLVHEFSFENTTQSVTDLVAIYPTTDTIPENLLKVYLVFSGPMKEGEVYDKVYLTGPNDIMVSNPFLRLEPELWDQSNRIITLWIDPGRVKRSLGSREAHGLVMEAGKQYQLTVDSSWRDAQGKPLDQTYGKSFFVVPADRKKPTTDKWTLTIPAARTTDPLIISFDNPMDFSTAANAFKIYQPDGEEIKGSFIPGNKELSLIFNPVSNWIPGDYSIMIKSVLEDLAGNNLNRVFDRDLQSDPTSPVENEFYELQFQVF